MGSNISKIERVSAPQNAYLWVDLCMDKRTGWFFADVGGTRIQAETKLNTVTKIEEALRRVSQVDWREVILIRAEKKQAIDDEEEDGPDESNGMENGRHVYSSSCSFTYLRRERASNPIKPKETIEREHRCDFEQRVVEARKGVYFGSSPAEKKKRADEVEQDLRAKRSVLADISSQWTHFRDRIEEFELPYSDEAWEGIRRIAAALREMQDRLDTFARGATADKLAALAAGDVLRQLPAAPVQRTKNGKRQGDE